MNRPELIKERPRGLIAEFRGVKPPAPYWFEKAIATEPERSFAEFDGAKIEMLSWGERGKPGLLFLHGNGAHAHWWSHIAPQFAKNFRVVAMSFSGMGNSDQRDHYNFDQKVGEVLAVLDAGGLRDAPVAPVVVAHSFGAFVGTGVAAHEDAKVRAVILLDGPFPTKFIRNLRTNYVVRQRKIYSTIEEAVMRFRFVPEQECENAFIIDWIARTSLTKVKADDGTEGWSWSSDPKFWKIFEGGSTEANMAARKYPIAMIGAARSRFTTENVGKHWLPQLQPNPPIFAIPNARHHIMADEPLALVAALRAMFNTWPAVAG